MEYFILDENNQQIGPFSIDQLKTKKISKATKVWCNGMKDWSEAGTVQDFKDFFIPPPPPNIPPTAPTMTNSANLQNENHSQTITKHKRPPV